MNAAVLSALAGYWRRNPLQLITLLAGLALATALWSGVQAINAEARVSYDAAASTLGEGRYAQITSANGAPIAQQSYVALRRAGWLVSPVIEGRVGGVRVVGLEPLTAPGGIGPVAPPRAPIWARFCRARGRSSGGPRRWLHCRVSRQRGFWPRMLRPTRCWPISAWHKPC